MNMITRSIQKELNHYYKLVKSGEFDIQEISKSAFTQARAKLKHTAFVELSDMVVEEFYGHSPWMSWFGRRVLSIDGSTIQLPDSPSLREVYTVHNFGAGEREKILAQISHLHDPLNNMVLHASVGRYVDSEMFLCESHFDSLESGDVLLLDRYYAATWLMLVLQSMGVDFVIRMNEKNWKAAQDLLAGKVNEKTAELQVYSQHYSLLEKYNITERRIKCRLIRTTLKNGEKMVLCTSLMDKEAYSRDQIIELYAKRWGIEESYKFLKSRLDLENFTGKTPHAILQDVYVKVLLSNICTLVTLEEQMKQEQKDSDKNKKHSYRVNRSFALSSLKDIPIYIFLKRKLRQALDAFRKIIAKALVPIRPNRTFPRRSSPRRLSKMNYKPL
jgi:hypothetical protein